MPQLKRERESKLVTRRAVPLSFFIRITEYKDVYANDQLFQGTTVCSNMIGLTAFNYNISMQT